MASPKALIELVFFDAGGGHRAAAEALAAVLAQKHPNWRVRTANLQEILKPADLLFQTTGVTAQDFYNAALRNGLTYGSKPLLRLLQRFIRLDSPKLMTRLADYWRDAEPPNLVVSLIPNFNRVMFRALRAARPGTPFVTVMTDMADVPPHFWMEKQDQFLICGTKTAAQQARQTGWYKKANIFETSGMILRPGFYEKSATPLTRAALGLSPNLSTAIVMFGGYSTGAAADIAEKLTTSRKLDAQCIVMCGRNEALRKKLEGQPRIAAIGYTKDVAAYMRLADFFVGKPGPGSLSEAWQCRLPTLVENNARTMVQERPNVAFMQENGYGVAMRSFSRIDRIAATLIASGDLKAMRKKLRAYNNRAVFEIADILQKILKQTTRS